MMRKLCSLLCLFCLTIYGNTQFSPKPLLVIDVGEIPENIYDTDPEKVTGKMRLFMSGQLNDHASLTYDGFIGIEYRGSTSLWTNINKSYSIETRDSVGQALNTPLAGLPKENDWVLHGNGQNDRIAFGLYRLMGQYAPRTVTCRVIINGEDKGDYELMEKIKRDKNRVDITALDSSDITGGYIFKLDKTSGDNNQGWYPSFSTQGMYLFHDPKGKELSTDESNYLYSYWTSYENDFFNYASYIDIPSFVDYMILVELTANVDAYRISQFFHKDTREQGGKVHAGPPWDYNQSLGDYQFFYASEVEKDWQWEFNTNNPGDGFTNPPFWEYLFKDYYFSQEFACRWKALRTTILSEASLTYILDSLAAPSATIGWIKERANWIDNHLSTTCPITNFDNPSTDILITEIMYHSLSENTFNTQAYDFIELHNPTNQLLDISGYKFTSGIQYTFPVHSFIQPNEYVVIVSNMDAFKERYPSKYPIGEFEGTLSNSSDSLTLVDRFNQVLFTLRYADKSPWPYLIGHSIVLKNPAEWAIDPQAWAINSITYGNPCKKDTLTFNLLEEHLDADFVQLFPNPTSSTLQLVLPFLSQDYSFELYTMYGQLISTTKINNPIEKWDISSLSNGLYLGILKKDNQVIHTFKVTKE